MRPRLNHPSLCLNKVSTLAQIVGIFLLRKSILEGKNAEEIKGKLD